MAEQAKSEINLEISTGFFRISTESVVYNITVLDDRNQESGASRAVNTILSQETSPPAPRPATEAAPVMDLAELAASGGGDDYYERVSKDIFNDIGQLAKSLSSTLMHMPMEDRRMKRANLDEAGEKIEDAKRQLQDIVSMTEKATMEIMDQVEKVQEQTSDVRELLSHLREHSAFQVSEKEGEEPEENAVGLKFQELQDKLGAVNGLVAVLQEQAAVSPAEPEAETEPEDAAEAEAPAEVEDLTETVAAPVVEKKIRYLFDIDTVFQTMYELCTNETVKSHITSARESAADIFTADTFIDALGERIADLEPDSDNFFTVPLSDVLQSLLAGCSDKKIKNLLTKMDQNQTGIFLDQSLPLEVPPTEEVEVVAPAAAEPEAVEEVLEMEAEEEAAEADEDAEDPPVADTEGGESTIAMLASTMAESLALADELGQEIQHMRPCSPGGMSMMSMADQNEIFAKIEDAFHATSVITEDVTRITEALSFQDLSGQQILKIIKLLSDFQVQLLAIVVSFGSQLKSKEKNAEITAEESKRLAQEDVDKYLKSMTTEEVAGEGALDQDAVNHILEELGF